MKTAKETRARLG